jgi:hypothetical protein
MEIFKELEVTYIASLLKKKATAILGKGNENLEAMH